MQQIWNVPARNPHFTGRAAELGEVARGLAAGSPVTVESVRGMGGVGKSQLAIEYAHAHAGDYDVAWWVNAEETAAIADQFTTLAAQLGLDAATDPDDLQAQVHDRLRNVAHWLLIFDNASTTDDIQPWLSSRPQPAGVAGHVLVTTRRRGFADLGQVHRPGCDRRCRMRCGCCAPASQLDQHIGKQIAQELGRLPLALEQAAAYLDRPQMPAADYLRLLHERAVTCTDAAGPPAATTPSPPCGTSAWNTSTGKPRHGAAPGHLRLPGPRAHPAGPVHHRSRPAAPAPVSCPATRSPSPTPSPPRSTTPWPSAPRPGCNCTGWSKPLSEPATRQQAEDPPQATEPTPGHSAGEEGWRAGGPLAVALALLRADAPGQITSVPQEWPRWAVLLPHVLAATGHLGGIAPSLGPAVIGDASWLLDEARAYMRVRTQPSEARPMQEQALGKTQLISKPGHPDVASSMSNLAHSLQVLGRPGDARPLQERALAIDEASYGPDHLTVAIRLNNLALILRDLGQPEQAQPLQERALAISEAIGGPDRHIVATALNNLALTLRALGQPGDARPLQERALAIEEAIVGPDDPTVAIALDNLAQTLKELGQPEQAQPLQERALAIEEAIVGPDDPTVAIALDNLAQTLKELGQPEQAQPLQERALAITEATYGPDHPTVAIALNNLGLILWELGQPEQAQPLQERALAIDEATYGPDHPTVAAGLNNLAAILNDLGQPHKAWPLLERALAITEARRSPQTGLPGRGKGR